MTRRSLRARAALLLFTAVAATACGASHAPAAQRAAKTASTVAGTSHVTAGKPAGQTVANHSGSATSVQAPVQQQQQQQSAVNPAAPNATHPSAASTAAPYVWSLHAQVTPQCVVAGQTARVTVQTAYNAALAYVAVYAGNKSGAAPPFGYGYGGNSDGYSSRQDGTWADTWTIRADAPRGTAHVTVVAASHQTSKRVDVPFTVVDPLTGSC